MPDNVRELYERDILAWSDQQAARLRDLRGRLRENEEGLDWDHVIEEIEDVGHGAYKGVRKHLRLALEHLLKLVAWPHQARHHNGWLREVRTYLRDARDECSAAMRNRLAGELDKVYAAALDDALSEPMDGVAPGPVPRACPVVLDDLIPDDEATKIDVDALLEQFRAT